MAGPEEQTEGEQMPIPAEAARQPRDGKPGAGARLLAISDLHVSHPENRYLVDLLQPGHPGDWLIVAGDVAERIAHVSWALRVLTERFAQVIWAPGNHELWTTRGDPEALRGNERYQRLVEVCRSLGVTTPEDPYRVWDGPGGPVLVAPLFVLYDYSFLPEGATTKEEAVDLAYDCGVVCADEVLLHPDPYVSRGAWCEARVKAAESRLTEVGTALPMVLVNHFPLIREPTRALRYPQFAPWCGTERTADWHRRFNAIAVVYGHLHIRRTTWHDGVPFMEVSMGYPKEWQARGQAPDVCQVLPQREA
jgi:3',5'-cyclic AMP phosphodiesterase CpdA